MKFEFRVMDQLLLNADRKKWSEQFCSPCVVCELESDEPICLDEDDFEELGEPREIDNNTFQKCNILEEVIMPEYVTHLGEGAFRGCKNLKRVSMSAQKAVLESAVFADCRQLESVKLPSGLEKIRPVTFGNCIQLKSISIPETVREIEYKAFWNCKSLEGINIPGKLEFIGNDIITGCPDSLRITYRNVPFLKKTTEVMPLHELFGTIDEIKKFPFQPWNETICFQCMVCTVGNRPELLDKLLKKETHITKEEITILINLAIVCKAHECYLMLLEYKNQHIGYEEDISRKFSL